MHRTVCGTRAAPISSGTEKLLGLKQAVELKANTYSRTTACRDKPSSLKSNVNTEL